MKMIAERVFDFINVRHEFSVSLREKVHHFTKFCQITFQMIPDKVRITCARKSNFFVLNVVNAIVVLYKCLPFER